MQKGGSADAIVNLYFSTLTNLYFNLVVIGESGALGEGRPGLW